MRYDSKERLKLPSSASLNSTQLRWGPAFKRSRQQPHSRARKRNPLPATMGNMDLPLLGQELRKDVHPPPRSRSMQRFGAEGLAGSLKPPDRSSSCLPWQLGLPHPSVGAFPPSNRGSKWLARLPATALGSVRSHSGCWEGFPDGCHGRGGVANRTAADYKAN